MFVDRPNIIDIFSTSLVGNRYLPNNLVMFGLNDYAVFGIRNSEKSLKSGRCSLNLKF